jgi:predicted nucleic acid-binding protein
MPTDTDDERRPVVLLDTSTAIALMVEDHEAHVATLAALRGRRIGLAGHAWFETYSVLTRLPGGLRRSPADATRLLTRNVPASVFLGEAESAALIGELAGKGISGGAVYDALVGAAARQHRRPLMSSDARARPVYDALGVEIELLQLPPRSLGAGASRQTDTARRSSDERPEPRSWR